MTPFVDLHSLQHGATAAITFREAPEVVLEMVDHLALGLGDEPETPSIPGKPRRDADGERSAEPERVEQARPRAEFRQTLAAPHQVIVLFAGRRLHGRTDSGITRGQRLPLIQRLSRDLAGVIDPHQPRRMPGLVVVEQSIDGVAGGILQPRSAVHPRRAAQSAVEADDQPIECVEVAVGRFGHRASVRGAGVRTQSSGHRGASGDRTRRGGRFVQSATGRGKTGRGKMRRPYAQGRTPGPANPDLKGAVTAARARMARAARKIDTAWGSRYDSALFAGT